MQRGNETVEKDVKAAIESLVSASSTLARASLDPERRPYVDLAFDCINTVASTLQLILTDTDHRRGKVKSKPILRVVK